jgi:3D (Asp-Asp-Asp) domain-containing protein/septal ring factor EnvC (AmiA/AmiB activator)
MRRPSVVLLAAATAVVAGAVLLPSASGADSPRAEDLRRESSVLQARSRSAILELYSLEASLGRARAELSAIRTRSGELARQQASVRNRVAIARRTLTLAQSALARRLRLLYEHGETHPLEILLGAASLEEALTDLDVLRFAAEQDQSIIRQTRAERRNLAKLSRQLRAKRIELRRLERAAETQTAALARAHAERAAYLERLASQRRLKAAEIASLERQARAAGSRAVAATPTGPYDEAQGPQTLNVWATGYALRGRTASGLRTRWGVVAVDPALIPLGTRMTIPGYGAGVAADIGMSVQGARIDVWFPSRAEALAWGGRAVTVTLH